MSAMPKAINLFLNLKTAAQTALNYAADHAFSLAFFMTAATVWIFFFILLPHWGNHNTKPPSSKEKAKSLDITKWPISLLWLILFSLFILLFLAIIDDQENKVFAIFFSGIFFILISCMFLLPLPLRGLLQVLANKEILRVYDKINPKEIVFSLGFFIFLLFLVFGLEQSETASYQNETISGKNKTASCQNEAISGKNKTASCQNETISGKNKTARAQNKGQYILDVFLSIMFFLSLLGLFLLFSLYPQYLHLFRKNNRKLTKKSIKRSLDPLSFISFLLMFGLWIIILLYGELFWPIILLSFVFLMAYITIIQSFLLNQENDTSYSLLPLSSFFAFINIIAFIVIMWEKIFSATYLLASLTFLLTFFGILGFFIRDRYLYYLRREAEGLGSKSDQELGLKKSGPQEDTKNDFQINKKTLDKRSLKEEFTQKKTIAVFMLEMVSVAVCVLCLSIYIVFLH